MIQHRNSNASYTASEGDMVDWLAM